MKAKKLISMILALVFVLGLIVPPTSARAAGDAKSCIADLIGYYKQYQEAAQTDINRVLSELAEIDQAQYEAWSSIMSYWSYINTEMQVNIGTVPEGLPEDNSVAIVILGFALNSDGTMKDELIGRLETGLAVAEAYPNSYVVVTGGGTASGNPNVTEGGLMGQWLLEHGLSEDRLIIENKAPSTVGNAENTYKILAEEYPQVKSMVMVTSDYHVPRGCILFYSKCLLAAYETGGEPLELISNAGYYTGTNGYESISLQASGVAQVAGVSASSNLTLSQLTKLCVIQDEDSVSVTATYHNGFEQDVTDRAEIAEGDGFYTVTYTENGITLTGTAPFGEYQTFIFSVTHLENLIATAKAISPATYTRDSYAALTAAIEEAEALLSSGNYTAEEVDAAYAALEAAIAGLKNLVNVALKMNVTANCNQNNAYKVTDGTISTSNYWAGQNGSTNVPANESELVIALDGTYDLEAIRVYPYWSGQRIYQYELFTSVDGEEWEKVAENVSDDYATDQGFTHEVDATAAYIKLVGIRTEVVGRGDINNMHIIEIQAFGAEHDNIALYKPVISSGSDQSAASSAGAAENKANDGDPSSYWDAGKYENQPWIIVDLQGLYELDSLNVITYWMRTDNRYYHYDLYTSVDGDEWVKVGAKDWNTPETIYGETFDLSGQGIQAAYLKLVGIYNSANSAFHVNEIRAYGTEIVETPDPEEHVHNFVYGICSECCTLEEPARAYVNGITGTASSVDDTEPAHNKDVANAFDYNPDTFWASVPDGTLADAYLIADLGGERTINQVNYTKRWDSGAGWNCTGNLLDYIIEVSVDGNTWTQVAAGATVDGTTEITFDDVRAAYVKLTATQSYHWQDTSANTVMTVAEFQVFERLDKVHSPSNEYVVENEKPSTCTEYGSIDVVYYCEVCGEEVHRTTIYETVLGHNYDDGVETVPPTCTEPGLMTYTCELCGDSYTEEVEAYGHAPVTIAGSPATCENPGMTDGIQCCICTEWIVAPEEIPALGHSYDDGVETTAPTCTEPGVMTFTCSTCGDSYTEEIAATGHSYENGSCVNCGEADPDAVTVIAEGWSGYTTWKLTSDGKLTFSPAAPEDNEFGEVNLKNYWKVGNVLTLPWSAYAELITEVVIEDGINDIGQMAFYELPNLTTVTLGADIVEIRNYAFKNCTSLTTINMENVDFIREGAFYGCSALESLNFMDGVVVEDWAFSRTPYAEMNP